MNRITDEIYGQSIIVAEAIAAKMRREIAAVAVEAYKRKLRRKRRRSAFFRPLLSAIRRAGAVIASHYVSVEVISYLGGVLGIAREMPDWLQQTVAESNPKSLIWNDAMPFPTPEPQSTRRPPKPPQRSFIGQDENEPPRKPPLIPGPFGDDAPEKLRFPMIEEGAKRLLETNVLTREQFDAATDGAKQRSFTVAGDIEIETVQRMRDAIADNVDKGTSLKGFKDQIGDELQKSFIGPAHLETVYRTNVQAAFRDGRQTLLSNPIVTAAFPYQEYIAIRDDRVRDSHARLEQLGIGGTNVYRLDDPFWEHFTPPHDFNCRCAVNILTLDAAAERGVEEARKWMITGRPPAEPDYRYAPGKFPIEPKPGWGFRGRVGELATQ